MKSIIKNWTLMRGFRLALGIVVFVQALIQKDSMLGLLAAFLLITAFTNAGCCGASGCEVDSINTKIHKEIVYEELDSKK